MDLQISKDQIDSEEKHDAFLTLFGEEKLGELQNETEEDEDELPEGQMYRSDWDDLPATEKKEFVDDGGEIIPDDQ